MSLVTCYFNTRVKGKTCNFLNIKVLVNEEKVYLNTFDHIYNIVQYKILFLHSEAIKFITVGGSNPGKNGHLSSAGYLLKKRIMEIS